MFIDNHNTYLKYTWKLNVPFAVSLFSTERRQDFDEYCRIMMERSYGDERVMMTVIHEYLKNVRMLKNQ